MKPLNLIIDLGFIASGVAMVCTSRNHGRSAEQVEASGRLLEAKKAGTTGRTSGWVLIACGVAMLILDFLPS
jgi:hypothetical protein